MDKFRNQLIKLAYSNKELRSYLLPLLKESAYPSRSVKVVIYLPGWNLFESRRDEIQAAKKLLKSLEKKSLHGWFQKLKVRITRGEYKGAGKLTLEIQLMGPDALETIPKKMIEDALMGRTGTGGFFARLGDPDVEKLIYRTTETDAGQGLKRSNFKWER